MRQPAARARTSGVDIDRLTKRVAGKLVSHVAPAGDSGLTIHFADGCSLHVERRDDGLSATFASSPPLGVCGDLRAGPTSRQREYLAFITRYIDRFGIAPAERDIQRHFLVSAPSVNLLMQMLERRGFITRQRGVPRSIRIADHVKPHRLRELDQQILAYRVTTIGGDERTRRPAVQYVLGDLEADATPSGKLTRTQ